MMRVVILLLLWSAATQTLAQTANEQHPPVSGDEYQRIDAQRIRETAIFDAQEVACYKRFAVNDCLKKVHSQRRAMLADLRRQEASLHEGERKQQAAEQLQRSEQKALEKMQKDADMQAQDSLRRTQDKLEEQKNKQADHAARAASGAAAAAAPAPTGPTSAEQAQYRDAYARKQADAEKKRQEIAKRLGENKTKPASPLPVPP